MVFRAGQITVVAVGKLKEAHWRTAQAEYLKRLSRYTTLRLAEVPDVFIRGTHEPAVKREGETLLKAAAGAKYRVALDPGGKSLDSEELARYVRKQIELYGHIAFLIGGPLGLSEETLAACQSLLSLSAMTLPHELARVVLLEQLYRAFTILSGEKYHK